MNVTASGGGYWENLTIQNNSHFWATVNEQEKNLVKPYGDITRQTLAKEDTSLKTKVELETSYIDSKYYMENVKKIDEKDIKIRLLNCFLYNKHFTMVMEKRSADWTDPYSDGAGLTEKQEICMKYARYY